MLNLVFSNPDFEILRSELLLVVEDFYYPALIVPVSFDESTETVDFL